MTDTQRDVEPSEPKAHEIRFLQPHNRVWMVVFGVLLIFSLIVALALPGPDTPGNLPYFGAALGFIFGGVAIACVLMSWESFPYRIAMAIGIHFGLMLAFGFYVARVGGPLTFIMIGCFAILCQSLLIQIPLWLLRAKSGYRFAMADLLGDSDKSKPQFSIANILVITTGLAALMAICREAFPLMSFRTGGSSSLHAEWVLMFSLTGIGSVMVTLSGLWYLTTRLRRVWPIGVGLWLAVMAVQVFQFSRLPGNFNPWIFAASLHVTLAGSIVVTMVLLARSGRRVITLPS